MSNHTDPPVTLNIATYLCRTSALGPGLRNAVWFQGCPFHCAGCISPQWIPDYPNRLVDADNLAQILCSDMEVEGLTISGGEPFYQPEGLHQLLKSVKGLRPDFSIIVFSGYQYGHLKSLFTRKGVVESLDLIDILIDGLYVKELNNNQGLRGSSNQKIIRLTNRLNTTNFEELPRTNEVYFRDGYFQLAGVPDIHLGDLIQLGFESMKVNSNVRA